MGDAVATVKLETPARPHLTLAQIDVALAVLLTTYALALWWPTRALPYHWDGALFVERAARDLAARDFVPFVARYTDFAHPPLFVAALALGMKLFGAPLWIGHALVAPALPLLLVATYGAGVCSYGRRVGACAATFTGSSAVVVAEYGQVYFDLPLAALCALGLWAWLGRRDWLAGVVFALAAAIKIPALIYPLALLSLSALRREGARMPPLALPFAIVGGWLVYHHAAEGFWFVRAGRQSHLALDPATLLHNGVLVLRELFGQRRYLVAALGAGCALAAWWPQRRGSSQLQPAGMACALIVIWGCAFFAFIGEFGARYGIMLLPPSFLLSAAGLRTLLARWRGALPLAAVLACGLMAQRWAPAGHGGGRFNYRPDADLGYLDMIELGVDVARFVQTQHAGERIYGSWPEAYWLPFPELGYSTRSIPVEPCRDWRPGLPGRTWIFAHLYSPDARTCWKLIHDTHAPPERLFSRGGKWVQLHVLPAPE